MPFVHGGQIMARSLKQHGVDTVFVLTGGHIMGFLDGCVLEGLRVVDVRHEQAAAHAAEAHTRLTGRLGVAAVTAGPGVTDTITGVATAFASGTPMMVIGGRHNLRQELMGGLQEMDHVPLFRSITKWAGTGWQATRLAETISVAIRHAFDGRGGPVFLDVPMDVQVDQVDEADVAFPMGIGVNRDSGVSPDVLGEIVGILASAERPVVFGGGGLKPASGLMDSLAEALGAPTFLSGRSRGGIRHGHPLGGNYSRSLCLAQADVILALGVDWDFRTAFGRAIPEATRVIHVDADAARIGWNRLPYLGVVADPATVAAQLLEEDLTSSAEWVEAFREIEEAMRSAKEQGSDSDASPVHPNRFAAEVGAFFGPDSIVAVDGGDIVSTTARRLQVSRPGHVLDAGPFGTLGAGPGYAIAAKVAFPEARVGIVFGDGAFGFNGFEYDTMVRLGLPIIGVLGNDGVWNNIKTVHMAVFPERVVAADLGRRPYAAIVEAMGGHGEVVSDPSEIRPALERAEASGLPSLVEVHIEETRRMSSNYAS